MFVVLRVFAWGEVRRSHKGVFLTEAAANAYRLMAEGLNLEGVRFVVYSPSELDELEASGVVIRTL
jgi:hypothetical protein